VLQDLRKKSFTKAVLRRANFAGSDLTGGHMQPQLQQQQLFGLRPHRWACGAAAAAAASTATEAAAVGAAHLPVFCNSIAKTELRATRCKTLHVATLLGLVIAGVSFFNALAESAKFTGANMTLADLCCCSNFLWPCTAVHSLYVCLSSVHLLTVPTSLTQT
jgi:uncharacterized protein YjbI with pentapeptide repeats